MAYNISSNQWESELQFYVREMSKYYSITLVVFGGVSNIFAALTLSRKSFVNSITSVYLRFVSLMDMCALLSAFRYFLISVFEFDLRENIWACRVLLWFGFSCGQLSAWTLIAVTMERYLSIIYPVNIHVLCSAKKAKIVILVLLFTSLSLNSQLFFIFGDKHMPDGVIRCQPINDYLGLIQTLTDFVLSIALPCLLLTIFNLLIVVNLSRDRKQMTVTASVSPALVRSGMSGLGAARWEPIGMKSVLRHRRERDRSLTVTLVVVNVVFICCNCLVGIYNIIYPYLGLSVNVLISLQILFIMILFTGNALNFLLYFLTGSKFRREFYALMSRTICFGRYVV